MEPKQTKVVLGLLILVFFLWLGALGFGRRVEMPVLEYPALFDASKALDQCREFVVQYPRRVLGSIEARQSTGFLRDKLAALGYQISYSHFDATIAGHRQVGRNVLAFREGRTPEIIAVVAHYDTAPTTFEGAMDDGSGIGVLLELARIFAAEEHARSVLFIASDGEEWGMLGALDLARNYPNLKRIVAVLSLDYVSAEDLAAFSLGTTGQFGGFSPPWLRETARGALVPEGLPVDDPSGFAEHLQRAFLIPFSDQGPFLKAGIPAINLGSRSKDRIREEAIYHSAEDRIQNLKDASFQSYGRGAERIVRTLLSIPVMPADSMGSVRLTDSRYLPEQAMVSLHAFLFLPFVAMVWFHFFNHRKNINPRGVLRELMVTGTSLVPFLLAYFYIFFCWLLRLLPRYSLYPATPKDPILSQPVWIVLGGVLLIIIGGSIGLMFLVKVLGIRIARPDYQASKLTLLLLLLILIGSALSANSYWAAIFLTLPAWVWALAGPGVGPGGRAANRIWILAAGIPCYMLALSLAPDIALSWNLVWRGVIALSTGMFGLGGYLRATLAIILGFRFMAIQSHGGTIGNT